MPGDRGRRAVRAPAPGDERRGEPEDDGQGEEEEALWNAHKTQRNAEQTLQTYLNGQQKLTQQNTKTPYFVLYARSGKDANAVVVEPGTFDRPFVVDHVINWFGTDNADEAHYLAAFLNADGFAASVAPGRPVSLLTGDADTVATPADMRASAARFATHTTRVVPGLGHGWRVRGPGTFAGDCTAQTLDALADWLRPL